MRRTYSAPRQRSIDGVPLECYDIVSETCNIDAGLGSRLGFKRIFVANRDVKVTDVDKGNLSGPMGGIIIGSNKERLLAHARGGVKAVCILDARIDRKLMKHMSDNGIALCMPVGMITSSSGLARTRSIYMMGKLFAYAKKAGVHVSFVTLASSGLYACSGAQLIELAMLVGADEQYARYSISSVNKGLVE